MNAIIVVALVLPAVACASVSSTFPPEALSRIVLDLPEPWPTSLPEAVASRFDTAIADRRFIVLGEGDHYIDDKFSYRLAFLRELVARRALRHIAVEMGRSDALRIDRYLDTGDERWLDRVVLFGYRGETAREQRDLAHYSHWPEAQRRAAESFGAAEKRFYRAVRALSEAERAAGGGRIAVFGFDLDSTPGGGYEDARRLAESCAADEATAEIAAALTQPKGISGFDEVERLEAVARRIDQKASDLDVACGTAVRRDLRETIALLAASLRYVMELSAVATDASPGGIRTLRDVFDRRERGMDLRFSALVAELPHDTRVALLLHNLHAARASETMQFGRPPRASMWKNIGSYTESRFPGQTYVIWLLYARGTRVDAREASGAAKVSPAPDSLEAHLDRVRGPYVVFLADAAPGSLFDVPIPFGTDNAYGVGVLRGAIDALVFLPEANAP